MNLSSFFSSFSGTNDKERREHTQITNGSSILNTQLGDRPKTERKRPQTNTNQPTTVSTSPVGRCPKEEGEEKEVYLSRPCSSSFLCII
jgi:hypothetical protein